MIKLEVCVVERYADGLWKPVGRYHTLIEAEEELYSIIFEMKDYHLVRMVERNKTIYFGTYYDKTWHKLTLNSRAHTIIDPEFILDLDSASKHQNVLNFWLRTNDAKSLGEILSNIYSSNEIFDVLCHCTQDVANTLSPEEIQPTVSKINNIIDYRHRKAKLNNENSVLPSTLDTLGHLADRLRAKQVVMGIPKRSVSAKYTSRIIDGLCDDVNRIRGGIRNICIGEIADLIRKHVSLRELVSHLIYEILRTSGVHSLEMSHRAA